VFAGAESWSATLLLSDAASASVTTSASSSTSSSSFAVVSLRLSSGLVFLDQVVERHRFGVDFHFE